MSGDPVLQLLEHTDFGATAVLSVISTFNRAARKIQQVLCWGRRLQRVAIAMGTLWETKSLRQRKWPSRNSGFSHQ
jgi:hypothetical protein